jgi:hypothetical protein
MVLMNAGRYSRNAASIVNRTNTCGGNKKAGLAPRSGYWFMQSNPSLVGAVQRMPTRCQVSFTVQTQKYGYHAVHGGNMG